MIDVLIVIYWCSFFLSPCLVVWVLSNMKQKDVDKLGVGALTMVYFTITPIVNTLVVVAFVVTAFTSKKDNGLKK